MQLNATQKAAIERDMRQFSATYSGGSSQLFQDILDDIESGNIGITSNAWDVDALAKDGGHFAVDADTTTGLTFGYKAGRLYNGKVHIAVAAGTLALAASQTNYVEVSRSGVVSSNTVGFTSGARPLYQIVTSSGAITTITNYKSLLFSIPNGGITGDLLTQAQYTKVLQIPLGTISASTTLPIVLPPFPGTITGMRVVVTTTITQSDTDYWTFAAVNKGPSGGGSTALLLATDANTTKLTGGSGITNYAARGLTLTGTAANLDTAASDVVAFTMTKAGAAANLVNAVLVLEIKHVN